MMHEPSAAFHAVGVVGGVGNVLPALAIAE
jgi:hypothetical protein